MALFSLMENEKQERNKGKGEVARQRRKKSNKRSKGTTHSNHDK